MDKNYEQVIQEMNTLLMLKEHFKFMGIVYYGATKHYLPEDEFVNQFGNNGIAFTDGKDIYYCLNDWFTTPNAIFVTIHELLHIVSLHIERRGNRDSTIWNLACDHVVNSVCKDIEKKYGTLNVMDGCIFFEDLYMENPGYTAEEIYDKITQKVKKSIIMVSVSSEKTGSGKNSKSVTVDLDPNNEQNEQESTSKSSSGKKKSKSKAPSKILTAPLDVDEENMSEIFKDSDLRKNHKEIKIKANAFWNSIKNTKKGNQSGGLESYLEEMFKVVVPWDKLLENSILYQVQKRKKVTWEYPNILIRYPRLPGKIQRSKDLHSLIAVIDSSGSLAEEDLKTFRGVLISSASYFKNIFVIVHDYHINQFFNIKDPTEQKVFEGLQKIIGRGGTSHKDAFNKIEELVDNEKISSIIFLTDFYSDIERIILEKDYKFLKDYHTVWVLNKYAKEGDIKLYEQSKFDVIQI